MVLYLSLSQLHQIYLGGIQQTTDVNLKDVTLHYALLVWMTGKKNPLKSQKSPAATLGGHGHHQNNSGKKLKHHKKHKKLSVGHPKTDPSGGQSKSNLTNHQFHKSSSNKPAAPHNLPLMSIKSAMVPSSSKSSMIELTNLPKMIVPAHYIKKIISDKNVQKNSRNGPYHPRGRSIANREHGGRLSTSMGTIGRQNITLHAVTNQRQAAYHERSRGFRKPVRGGPTVLNTMSSPKIDRHTNDLQKTLPNRNHNDPFGKLRNLSAARHRTSHSLSRVKRELVNRLLKSSPLWWTGLDHSGTEIQPCYSNEMRDNRHKVQEGKLENLRSVDSLSFNSQNVK